MNDLLQRAVLLRLEKVASQPPAISSALTRQKLAAQFLEKVAILEPNVQDYYMAMGGPLGALKAPPGSRLSTAAGSGAGLIGGYYGGKALEKMMLERMSGKSGKAGRALSLLAKFPVFLSSGLGSVLGARAGQSM